MIIYIFQNYIKDVIKSFSHFQSYTNRFIQVETGFFWKWWRNQNTYIQDIVKDLVDEGRLEFIGGGWSMNDEATTHYSSIIDNMSFGFKTLLDTFGKLYLCYAGAKRIELYDFVNVQFVAMIRYFYD